MKTIFITILIIIILSGSIMAQNNAFNNIILKEGDIEGIKLDASKNLKITWPVVQQLPSYMRQPENYIPQNFVTSEPLVISSLGIEGIRQQWVNKSNQAFLTVDYGIYANSQQAYDALYYMVYCSTGQTNYYSYQFPYTNYAPSCRKINYADLCYWVSYQYGGGYLYFVKDRYIFRVDSFQQTIEDQASQILLGKVQNLK
jgi:hypothetical protein